MTKPVVRSLLLSAWLASGCPSSGNICPEGSRPSAERGVCVDAGAAVPDARVQPESPRADATPPDAGTDAMDARMPPMMPVPDTGVDADAGDAGVDGPDKDSGPQENDTGTADTGIKDAGPDAPDTGMPPDATTDGGVEGGAGPVCSEDDQRAWAAFHHSPTMLDTINTCLADPRCALGTCPLVTCIRDGAGMLACEDCLADEATCMLNECRSECATSSTSAECLSCACEAGCTAEFARCTGEPFDVCDACEPAILYCGGMHPWPALFVPIMHPLL